MAPALRLLVWASTYGHTIGGGPVLTPLLMSALAARGHEIVVVTDRRPERLSAEQTSEGVRIVRPLVQRALAGDLPLLTAIRRDIADLKRSFRPEAIHIFSSGYAEFFHHATSAVHPAPLAVTLHDCFPVEAYGPGALVGRNLRAAHWVTACSRAVFTRAVRHIPSVATTGTVVLNALPPVPPGRTREPRPQHLVYAGRLVRQKGIDTLIAALALVVGRFPRVELTVLGDGEERSALERDAERLGIAKRVSFSGSIPREQVYAAMASAAVVVVPSRTEPFGLVALEAAQVGRPVVASAVDGLPEVVVDNETGVLVPPDDPEALAAAIAGLLDEPERGERLGRAARQRAEQYFRWRDFVDAYELGLMRMASR